MTNSVMQNVENGAEAVLNNLINIDKNKNFTYENGSGKFSNLISNLSAKTQKTQTNFVEKAIKSNTSSINTKALSQTNKQSDFTDKNDDFKIDKNDLNELSKNDARENIEIENENDSYEIEEDENSLSENSNEITTDENDCLKQNDAQNDDASNDTQNDRENLSDINNNSLVETSPVFSSTIEVSDTIVQNDVLDTDIIDNVQKTPNLTILNSDIKNEDLKQKTEEIVSKIETLDDLTNAVEEISDLLNNSNLKENDKNDILNLLNKIKTNLNDISSNTQEIDFNNLINEIKNVQIKISNLNSNVENSSNNLEIQQSIKDFENKVSELQNKVNKIDIDSKDGITELKNALQEFSKIKDELKNSINLDNEKLDNKKLNNSFKQIEEVFSNIEKTMESLDSLNNILNKNSIISPDELKTDDLKFMQIIKDIKANLSKLQDLSIEVKDNIELIKTNSITFDEIKDIFSSLSEKIKDIDLSKIENTEDFSNLDVATKENIKEIFNLFEKYSNETDTFPKELKNEIDDIVNKIVNSKSDNVIQTLSGDELKALTNKITEVQSEVQNIVQTGTVLNKDNVEFKDNSNIKSENVNLSKNNDANIKISSQQSLSNNNSNDTEFSNNDNEQLLTEDEIKTLKAQISNDIEIDTNEDIKTDEVNVQKQNFISEINEDILVDIDVSFASKNLSTLSVSDEIVKLSIDEIGVLKNDSVIKGNLLYDSISGNNSIIKNPASMLKTTQNLENPFQKLENSNLMSQLSEKLTHLKDNVGQKLTMVLRPHDLGRLQIQLTSNNLGLTTNIMAQNDEVRNYIEKNIDVLRKQLQEAGINVNNIQIKTAGSETSTNYSGNQNSFLQDSENNRNNNQNNENNRNNPNNNKEKEEILTGISNYDYKFSKDFSSVLHNSINYSLN